MTDTRVVSPMRAPSLLGFSISRAGERPHNHSDAFRALWYGASISELALWTATGTDSGATGAGGPFCSVGYTECGNVITSGHKAKDAVGLWWGADNEKIVAAVDVSIQ